jgi:isopenicillin N synthase-like dioxygenase
MKKLPIINLSKLSLANGKTGELKLLDNACRKIGFFYLVGHGIEKSLMNQMLDESRKFFHQPQNVKDLIIMDKKNNIGRGYQRIEDNITLNVPDYHEAIDFIKDDETQISDTISASQDAKQNFKFKRTGKNLWPKNPPLRKLYEVYIQKMINVGNQLLPALAKGLDLPTDYFDSYFSNPYWIMRTIYYPPYSDHKIGCGEHTDYGCLTFVLQDNVQKTLQVKTRDGEWINADSLLEHPDALVVNIGDMMNIWSNGIYSSTPHRVLSPKNQKRLSIPFFFEPNFDSKIKPYSNPTADPIHYGKYLEKKVLSNFYSN